MKTVFVTFGNHFDLVWRRAWERAYEYLGGRYASYAEVESAVLDRILAMAAAGQGVAYQVEQTLTLRMYLRQHPEALSALQALYRDGRFEVQGAGEAIIDVNMCAFETMARNLASGVRFCRDVLGMPPWLACHTDGFGSSAQFPQVIRGCGFRAVQGLAYSLPDKEFWRGLDGSVVYYWRQPPGRGWFYDHCYHEPCPVCRGYSAGKRCAACDGTGYDLAQNFYPPFEPLQEKDFQDGLALAAVTSEEMLPPTDMERVLAEWRQRQPDVQYRWGTQRHLASLVAPAMALTDAPPADRVSTNVENNPAQSGCLVSRARMKIGARRCEAEFFGVESALAAGLAARHLEPDAVAAWHDEFLELPLYFFHDAITGTHQDVAAAELLERMAAHRASVADFGRKQFSRRKKTVKAPAPVPGATLNVFNPRAEPGAPLRIPLSVADWHTTVPLVAETADGVRLPVTQAWHAFSPPVPLGQGRLINAVGSGTRSRPLPTEAFIEARGLTPLAWSTLTLREAAAPTPIANRELRNASLCVKLGDHGVEAIMPLASDHSGDARTNSGNLPGTRELRTRNSSAVRNSNTGSCGCEVRSPKKFRSGGPGEEPLPFANAHCRLTAAGALWARSKGSPPAESVIVSEPDFPIGGLRVDEDEGDPWGTRKIPAFRRSLAPFTRFLGARQFEGYAEAYYGGVYEPNLPFGNEQDPAIFALEWQITVRLLAAAARVDFEYEVFWKTANRRVRGVFPVQAGTDTGWYSIPGGWLARPRYDQTETKLWSANGDWPALYFAAAQGATATSGGWAVANYGTPANRIEDGRIVVSFLRSPGFGHCLERYAQNYPMPTSGIRDPGWHHFTLSLLPHAGHDDLPRLAQTAAALNARPFTLANGPATLPNRSWLELESATVELVACKPAFQPLPAGVPAHAVVLRLVNLADAAGCATLRFADVAPITLQECNLLEDPTGLTCSVPAGQAAEFSFTPFQVRTFLASSACSGQTPASEPAVRSRSDH